MRDLTSFVVFLAMAVGTVVSKPLWSTVVDNDYVYTAAQVNAQPQYFTAFQNAHSPYYVYNVHASVGSVPNAILASGKPEIHPAYGFYYGTPLYNFRIPLSPIYPVLTPSQAEFPSKPLPPPTSSQSPFDQDNDGDDDDDDGIEKLDTKVDPDTGTKKPANTEQDDDSITVEAV